MKHGEKMLICTLAGLALCAAASAVTSQPSGSPYQGIVERNVFGLKPPPPPPDPEANKPPPPKITLQGFTTFGGIKRALLKAQMPPKPGEPPKAEQGFVLAEGQRDGDIEVLEIDVKAGTVKVNDFGTITNLNFENNGIKTAATAAPVPGVAPRPGVGFPPSAVNPTPFTPAVGTQPTPFTRPSRLPLPTGAGTSPAYGGATPVYATGTPSYGGGTPTMAVGGTSVPLYGSTPAQTQPQVAAQPTQPDTMTAEQKFLLVEAYRAKMKQSGQQMPPIPPTPLTKELNPPAPQ
jgi:hypothetical protein